MSAAIPGPAGEICMAEIVLERVTKDFGTVRVLDALDLHVLSGEFLVLLGPSGCGKTTTMRIIAGLEAATEGNVLVNGVNVNSLPARDRDMAMVFQNYGLYPHMTVAENIGYPLRLRGIGRAERDRLVKRTAGQVQLSDLLDRKPRELSGGQRQRVAFARAFVRRPNAFLMDEPLSNLDAKLRVRMRAELKRLHHEIGITTVYVTHDQIEAITLATRVAIMNEGRIVQLGSPEEIYNDPATAFVAEFVGTPEINLVRGSVRAGVFEGSGLRVEGCGLADGKHVQLGIRPHLLDVCGTGDGNASGTVYSAEYGGDATYLTVRLGDGLVRVLASVQRSFELDSRVDLKVRPGDCMFFSADGARLRPAAGRGAGS